METALSTLAQVFVGALVGAISNYYVPAILEKIGTKWDVKEEMKKLSVILLTIKVVLEDAEEKQVTNELIGHWLRELKDTAYDVEDLLDECATEEALHEPESTGSINCAAIVDIIKRFFMNNFEEIAEQSSMTKRIKLLINKFEEIAEQKSNINLFNPSSTSTTRVVNYRVDPRRETSSFPTELKLYGRDEEKERIVNLMVNNINAGNLSIYAIVGIGGLGKTTLAQMVYNDNMVTSRFEIKRWVCVSENFEVKSLIGDIIQSESNNSSQTLDQLQRHLQNILRGKRFLLILDDVWNEDEAKWERLKSSLSCGAEGSSIIVTTRSGRVAEVMCIKTVWRPNILSDEDCFLLFKHHAFAEDEGDQRYLKLKSIGKEIVKKCGGVPLAAKALGGILRFLREENEWSFVRNSELWDLPQDKDDSILPALRLSYKHLPQHLRQCFGYCSIFPKDHIMEKEVLVQLWMANGFFQSKGNMELEDIGNGIFNDLLWRSLFQDVQKDHDGNVVSCKMHDLMHDLACSITRDECFSVVTAGDEDRVVGRSNTTRHLAVDSNRLFSPNFCSSISQSFLRTFLYLGMYNFNSDVPPPLEFPNLMYLRALDLRQTLVETLPVSIGKMKLLRYLDLSKTRIALLPDEIFCNLRNLQTLKLCDCKKLERLPESMSELTKLRHLDITGSTGKLVRMPFGMGQLKCLHMLSDFIVSEDHGCGVEELQGLDHLGGTLALRRLRKVRNLTNAKLIKKQNIRYLQLDWSDDSDTMPQMKSEKLIAEALKPHPNIERLDVHNYGGSEFPTWMNSTCLSNLVTLLLRDCSKCKHLPTLGLLPRLKVLQIHNILSVKCIGDEFYSGQEESNVVKALTLFPALEELYLFEMPSLEEWKGWSSSSPLPSSSRMKEGEEAQVSVFPVLKTLKITECPKLSTIPPLPLSIQHLELRNSNLKILERSLHNLPHLSDLSISNFFSWSPDQGMVVFQNLPVLQSLKIFGCGSLVSLPEGMQHLTSLKSLTIENCLDLKSLNKCLKLLTNLHSLDIIDCHKLELQPDDFKYLVSLEHLKLKDLRNPQSLVLLHNLTTLQRLEIIGCLSLVNLPEGEQSLHNLTTLQRLEIINCPSLLNLPEKMQASLEFLTIEKCNSLEHLNNCFQLLTNLHSLRIRGCPALKLLSSDFEHLISLKVLQLEGFPKLEAVPVVKSSTLKTISFSMCPHLKNLPEWITNQTLLQTLDLNDCKNLKSLPEGFQQLTALQSLQIKGCDPLLYERCKKDTGLQEKIGTRFPTFQSASLDRLPH